MKGIMTTLTDKREPFVRTVLLARIATDRASLTGKMGIHFDDQGASKRGFVGKDAVKLSKSPTRRMTVRPSLLLGSFFASVALRSFSNVGQVLNANDGLWVTLDDVFRNRMIGVQLKPS